MTPSELILIADDQADFARGLARLIEKEFPQTRCLTAGSGAEALDVLGRERISLLVTDMRMPGCSGMELMKQALNLDPQQTIIMLTAFGSIEMAVEAVKSGAFDFMTKPVDKDTLFRVLSKGLERVRLLGENARLREIMAQSDPQREFIGQSQPMRRLRESVAAVAGSDYTVLITGESGTGKELAARTIHRLSQRNEGPRVVVNCPAIPDQLLESELFGHIKGAFTGADRPRKGLFLAAHGGSILLDEIGDIPGHIQTKLLRVLQEQEIRPVGSNESIKVNVRILASTNQDLEAKMQAGTMRQDLFYRLNVLQVHIPPLRQRMEDIPLLAHHFLNESCAEMGIPPRSLSPEALAYLSARPWPGNVRELQNFMRRFAVFGQYAEPDINLVRLAESLTPERPPNNLAQMPYHEAKNQVLDDFTRTYVGELLKRTHGNISEAARVSGLERVSLQKILKRLDITASQYK